MRLFEYHAKTLLKENGLAIPIHCLVTNSAEIPRAIEEIGSPFVTKVQTLVGGRGKAGGVKLFSSEKEAVHWFQEKMGSYMNGSKVKSVLIEEVIPIESEYYVAFTLDTQEKELKFLFSTSGGINVEDSSEELFTYNISYEYGIEDFKLIEILSKSKVPKERWQQFIEVIHNLYGIFLKFDCTLLEINPLVWTKDEEFIVLDIHMYVDDNSIPKHSYAMQIINEMPDVYPQIWYKTHHGFDVVILNPTGSVGLVTTGAGLTMATIDELQNTNIKPINFCDIRSGQLKGDPTRLIVLLETLKQVPTLKCVFVSIFAGITDLAEFANTLLEAKERVQLPESIEWVIRLEGNNFTNAKQILEDQHLFVTNSLEMAIERIKKGVVMS